jgi:hypothetical protein
MNKNITKKTIILDLDLDTFQDLQELVIEKYKFFETKVELYRDLEKDIFHKYSRSERSFTSLAHQLNSQRGVFDDY